MESAAYDQDDDDDDDDDATCLTSLGCSSIHCIQHIAVICSSFFPPIVPKKVFVCVCVYATV